MVSTITGTEARIAVEEAGRSRPGSIPHSGSASRMPPASPPMYSATPWLLP
jgi:hypothetical protein